MEIKTPEVYSMIEAIGEHFRANISNRFTRGALAVLPLDNAAWGQIEELTEKTDNHRFQGYTPDELYVSILAIARFISMARRQVPQSLRYGNAGNLSPQDRILRDMVVNNFNSNLNILADLLNTLYMKIVEIGRASCRERV